MQITLRSALVLSALLASITISRASEAEAVAISENIQARHLPHGTILDPVFAAEDSDEIVGYTRCADSAIWTGHYLAAEAFRYKVTKSPIALANVRSAIAGIKSLLDVTGDNLLARCIVPMSSPYAAGIQSEESHNGIYTNSSAGYIWVGNTSRDQYSGVMFGLAVTYDMVEDPDIRSSVSELVTRNIDFLRGHDWNVVMPDGKISTTFAFRGDQILSFVQIGRHVNPDHFSSLYDRDRILLSAEILAPIGVDVASDDSYFKFNLNYINLYNLVRLESSVFRDLYEKAYDITRSHTAGHKNAFFNVIDLALKGPNKDRDTETLALLEAWLLRQRRDKFVILNDVVPVCGDEACSPVPVELRPPTDFLWQRNPRQLSGGLYGTIEGAGIDYILPYWMARFYALEPAFTVQSAAVNRAVVAPGSLVWLLGTKLSPVTEDALEQPWPATLGGVSVTVRDATGSERAASLMHVSPDRIILVVPERTAPGVATFLIANGGEPVTAFGGVQTIAPALFSVNGYGTGVVLASAVRTTGDSLAQTPVQVFACDDVGCFTWPIDLSSGVVHLTLYGTGIRNRQSDSDVSVTIGGVPVPVESSEARTDFGGMDTVTVELTQDLRGMGEADVVLTVAGKKANTVKISVQ